MPIRNLILDWSGTLAHDLPLVVEATNAIFQHYGAAAWSEEEFRSKFYLPFPEFYREFLPQAPLEELDRHYHLALAGMRDRSVPLLPHARDLLQLARDEGLRVFLLSSIHQKHWEEQAGQNGILPFFDACYTGVLDKRRTILDLLAAHGLEPRETMFVGDMQHDVDSAHHAGVISCAVLTGYNSLDQLKKSQPHLLFRDLAGVIGYLKRHRVDPTEFPIATVGGLVFNAQGEGLLVRTFKWSNLWGIPGGKIRRGETAELALRREMAEETALEIDEIRFVMAQDCIDSPEFFRPAHFLLLNYTARCRGSEAVQLNDEADAFVWMKVEKALAELPLNKPTRILLESVRVH